MSAKELTETSCHWILGISVLRSGDIRDPSQVVRNRAKFQMLLAVSIFFLGGESSPQIVRPRL